MCRSRWTGLKMVESCKVELCVPWAKWSINASLVNHRNVHPLSAARYFFCEFTLPVDIFILFRERYRQFIHVLLYLFVGFHCADINFQMDVEHHLQSLPHYKLVICSQLPWLNQCWFDVFISGDLNYGWLPGTNMILLMIITILWGQTK